jgi:hypothetical protein
MNLAYGGDVDEANRFARETIRHCEAAPPRPAKEHWRLASLGDAQMIVADVERSLESHTRAMQVQTDPWQALSSQEQALRVADLCADDGTVKRLSAIYVPA